MPNSINEYFQPSSTNVHSNIDELIVQSKLDEFAQTGVMYKQPESPRSVADALAMDFAEGLLPIGAGVKLFRGVPKWVKGQMVKGGSYKSPPNLQLERMKKQMDDYLVNRTGGAPFVDPEGLYGEYLPSIIKGLGTWASKSKKEALSYANLGKKGERMLLEFDVPNKVFKENIKSANPFRRETWFEGGIPKEYLKKVHKGFQEGGVVQPSSTDVHSNIDELILQEELDKLAQTGSMRADTRPQYIGGVDPFVENIALSPLLQLKRLKTIGKELIEKTGLRNPVYHFTKGESVKDILESGAIKGAEEAFPGKPFKKRKWEVRDVSDYLEKWNTLKGLKSPKSPAVSITRDPMFLERPHKHVGTDVRFVMDRDELVKKGFKIQPFAETGFRKAQQMYRGGGKTFSDALKENYIDEATDALNRKLYKKFLEPNPRFEFEERVRGYIPTENIKLIDLIQLPMSMSNKSEDLFKILDALNKSKIPIIKSPLVRERLGEIKSNVLNERDYNNIIKLLSTPTYPNSPI